MDTCKANHTQFHDEMIYEFLDLFFRVCAVAKVAFSVDIEECRVTADGHSGTILFFDSAKVAKVNPLHSFFHIFSWFGNIVTIGCSHFFQFFQGTNLFFDLFAVSDYVFKHITHSDIEFLVFLFD